ncbi:MAG TPA: hypothetical protein PK671_26610, partial [Candidatus Obscuribacter sp.]|nr:hypothetical protein [Candidatus Obscuribacter sp.]
LAMEERTKKEPRWNDPEVVSVSIPHGKAEKIDFGWNPISSRDDSRVFYSSQKLAITGKRVLAKTQDMNEICAYDNLTKKISVLAKPTKGYFDMPMLSSDGRTLAYEICDVVNGDYGGCVGLGLIDLSTGKTKAGVKPAEHHKLPDLIRTPFWVQDQLIAVREIPMKPGVYMSDVYAKEIVNCTNGVKVLYKSKANSEADFKAKLSADNMIEVFDDEKHLKLDAKTGKQSPIEDRRTLPYMYRPDRKFRVLQSDNIEVQSVKTGKAILKMKNPVDPSADGCLDPQFIWSADSSMLALVVDKAKNVKGQKVFDRSELKILDLRNVKI